MRLVQPLLVKTQYWTVVFSAFQCTSRLNHNLWNATTPWSLIFMGLLLGHILRIEEWREPETFTTPYFGADNHDFTLNGNNNGLQCIS